MHILFFIYQKVKVNLIWLKQAALHHGNTGINGKSAPGLKSQLIFFVVSFGDRATEINFKFDPSTTSS